MDNFAAFCAGMVIAGVVIISFMVNMQPEIKREELYRFCLEKSIKLEDCRIPERKPANHQPRE